mmetsp:Transcript_11381/g.32201  ORF Transcript_11381/g.32201 Transcript_11381/m.32201 type:complete len:235 (+) Transcript_11381:2044-2748(+)
MTLSPSADALADVIVSRHPPTPDWKMPLFCRWRIMFLKSISCTSPAETPMWAEFSSSRTLPGSLSLTKSIRRRLRSPDRERLCCDGPWYGTQASQCQVSYEEASAGDRPREEASYQVWQASQAMWKASWVGLSTRTSFFPRPAAAAAAAGAAPPKPKCSGPPRAYRAGNIARSRSSTDRPSAAFFRSAAMTMSRATARVAGWFRAPHAFLRFAISFEFLPFGASLTISMWRPLS